MNLFLSCPPVSMWSPQRSQAWASNRPPPSASGWPEATPRYTVAGTLCQRNQSWQARACIRHVAIQGNRLATAFNAQAIFLATDNCLSFKGSCGSCPSSPKPTTINLKGSNRTPKVAELKKKRQLLASIAVEKTSATALSKIEKTVASYNCDLVAQLLHDLRMKLNHTLDLFHRKCIAPAP